jgi:hypothetical protein
VPALLTPVAWRYYLPAILRWCAREPVAVDVLLDNSVYQLERPEIEAYPGQRRYFEERATGSTDRQRAAVVAFLEWYRVKEEASWGSSARRRRGTSTTRSPTEPRRASRSGHAGALPALQIARPRRCGPFSP